MAISTWFVILIGLSTAFIGLICLILCKMLGAVCTIADAKSSQPQVAAPAVASVPVPVSAPVQSSVNRQEVIVAIGVAIAEEIGAPASAIRITSIKKI